MTQEKLLPEEARTESGRRIHSVSYICDVIAKYLSLSKGLGDFYMCGEISSLSQSATGRSVFFSLKDDNALLSCVMWGSEWKRLDFIPENGQKVICHCSTEFYQKQGRLQIHVLRMQREGQGSEAERIEALKKKLREEGLFDLDRKRKLPLIPRRIGVITSPSGAVIRDIIKVLKRRYPAFDLLLIPSSVQGEAAVDQLILGLQKANMRSDLDLVILARGGGSQEDLKCFNDERLARAIFASKLPVVSAVGHETDWSISDLVADVRAATPSVAAELVYPIQQELNQELLQKRNLLQHFLNHRLLLSRMRLSRAVQMQVLSDPYSLIQKRQERLLSAQRFSAKRLLLKQDQMRAKLDQYVNFNSSRIRFLMKQSEQRLYRLKHRIERLALNRLQMNRQKLIALQTKIEAQNPEELLNRGYAYISELGGHPLVSVRQVEKGQQLWIHMKDGQLKVLVDEKVDASAGLD